MPAEISKASQSLLIYAPVPVFKKDGALYAERQALNGLRLWADNFEYVTVIMPLAPGDPPVGWCPVSEHADTLRRVQIETVPSAFRPDQFLRVYRTVRARIGKLIDEADYLSFAIGGLFGDWGAVACFEAHRQNRKFAVWTDRVESEVTRASIGHGRWRADLRSRLYHRPMAWLEKATIRRATLGLFHGKETYEEYAPYCRNPQVVHDIHISLSDHIGDADMARKLAALRLAADVGPDPNASTPLKLLYVGRAEAMKGPMDWIEVLEQLHRRGVDFRATWLGDGDLLPEMTQRIEAAGLGNQVRLPGFVDDRERVKRHMYEAHIFLFCHQTPESPRCLIEALTAGTPIVGYDCAFARDLISGHQGGKLVPRGDVEGLAARVAELDKDRETLADLIGKARTDGAPFSDAEVFRHRSDLIKAHL